MSSLDKTYEVGGSSIYGRADDVDRIIKLISSENGTNLNSTVVSIISDRGSGRTTVLHLLQNELCTAFDKTRYICMPENFNEKGIMRLIIESLASSHCDITNLDVLKEIVEEELKDQRMLLLLDDFDNKGQECWDHLLALLEICKEKSVFVVTTTREAVPKVKGPMQYYYMNNLSNEWCWMIFQNSIFSGHNPDADTELVRIGKCLVESCGNVTLCIKMLSGVLKHSIAADKWKAVLDNNFWKVDEVYRDILPALRVCYEYLPFHLKQCFKYCSLFPKEYFFSKQQLVRMWLSQGFIEPVQHAELEDIGLEYFDQLLSRSFFQASFFPDMKEDRFVIPGLIHNLAKQLSKNECFQFEGSMERAPENACHALVHENACHLALVPHEFRHVIVRAQNLQTILVVSRSAFQYQGISSSILKFKEFEDLFIKFPTLITLDLSNADVEDLPESLGALNNLRYLNLSRTNIKRIPLELSNLIHLQTLEAKDCNSLGELPKTVSALTNLHYLDVTKQAGYVIMPNGIGKLTNLRNLPTINVGMDPSSHCQIDELKDMKYLKGCLEISGLQNVSTATDAKKADMRSKERIENLCFQWSNEMSYLEGGDGSEIAEEILESLYPTENLTEIIIRGYPGNSFPMWIGHAAFCRLVSIVFDNCYNCERLPALGGLPLLRFLSIRKMYCVQRMSLSGSEDISENFVRYPSLEQLTVWEMYGLAEWIEIEKVHFPILHSLCINNCPLLRNVPKFPALVELSVYSYAQFIETVDLPSLQSLRVEGLQKTKSFNLPKCLVGLKKLEISRCPELLSIQGLSLLNSLETIIAFRCVRLESPTEILDDRLFAYEDRGNTRVWLRKKNIAPIYEQDASGSDLLDEEQECPTSTLMKSDLVANTQSEDASAETDDLHPAVPGFLSLSVGSLFSCFRPKRKEDSPPRGRPNQLIISVDSISSVDVSSSSDKQPSPTPHRVPPSPSIFAMSPQLNRVGSVQLTINQILKATHNFSDSHKLGEGGFGTVYRALLPDGHVVAVKRAKKEHFEGARDEFNNEVELLSKIDHKNLVRLLGYVDKGNERILITEFVPNGTLREHLDGQFGKILDFNQRLEITIDIAYALTYLHLYAEKTIIHQDVKSSNILLTDSYRAKVSDFGFAKSGPSDKGKAHISTKVKGTAAGYLDPEYLRTYQLTPKSDVFSFGILLLEILSGRRPVELKRNPDERITVRWAFKKFNEGNLPEILDPRLEEKVDNELISSLLNVSFQCAALTRDDRPTMKEVAEKLWEIRKKHGKSLRRISG